MQNNKLDIKISGKLALGTPAKSAARWMRPKYKDYILPLIFFKRLSDVFEDELNRLAQNYHSKEIVEKLVAQDHNLVRFYLPQKARLESR
jgi:type I restriction enzyme M protein